MAEEDDPHTWSPIPVAQLRLQAHWNNALHKQGCADNIRGEPCRNVSVQLREHILQ